MIHIKRDDVSWTRSSFCGTGGCVEVVKAGPVILVRDGKIPLGAGGVIQSWEVGDWMELLEAIKAGNHHPAHRLVVGEGIVLGLPFRQHEPLTFSAGEWDAFVEGVLAGDFEPENLQAPAASSEVNAAAGGVVAGDDTAAATPDGEDVSRRPAMATGSGPGTAPGPVVAHSAEGRAAPTLSGSPAESPPGRSSSVDEDGGPGAGQPGLVFSDEIVALGTRVLCAHAGGPICPEPCADCDEDVRCVLAATYPLIREQWEASALRWGAGPLVEHNETSPASGVGEAAAVPPELEETGGAGATEPVECCGPGENCLGRAGW